MPPDAATILRACLSPQIIVRQIIRSCSLGSLEFRLAMQALVRPEYAFGILQAIYLAAKLRRDRVSVIEFGVGTGDGLLRMEGYARELGKKHGVLVEVYGFDTGAGLPPPTDYRDVPYLWKAGDYHMDARRLQGQLKASKLLLGDVQQTIPHFLEGRPAPIGFISFDLDYYSSTAKAFRLFDCGDELFLPRVVCYFDDIGSDGRALQCEYVGELLAIREFNERPMDHQKLCRLHIQEPRMRFPAAWLSKLYVHHRFAHPEYNSYLPT